MNGFEPVKECIYSYTDAGQWRVQWDEEIVRCRNCKRFSIDNSDHDYRSGWWCHRWNTDMVKPDGFCAWGKRKEQE